MIKIYEHVSTVAIKQSRFIGGANFTNNIKNSFKDNGVIAT